MATQRPFDLCAQESGANTVVTARLEKPAQECYELFCAVERIREWLSVIDSVRVLRSDDRGRAVEVEFRGVLAGATLEYTLNYEYSDKRLFVRWSSGSTGMVHISGSAHFEPVADGCVLHYSLTRHGAHYLPSWEDSSYERSPAETVVVSFCEWATE